MYKKILKFLASLKLAVFILLSMGVITAVGTFYESLYNADYAKLVVYQSYWMFGIQVLLAVNLIAVMLDRWPWKQRHLPFLLAHVGIVMILVGSLQTYLYGVDGVMVFPLGGSNQFVQVSDKELNLYSSLDGKKFQTLLSEEVNLFREDPSKKSKVFLKDTANELKLVDYYIFAEAKNKIFKSDNPQEGPAVRFFIEGKRAKESGWLWANKIFKEESQSLGLAKVTLSLEAPSASKESIAQKKQEKTNEILLFPSSKNKEKLSYHLYSSKKGFSKGELPIGKIVETGWMDFKFRIVNYYPHARRGVQFTKIDVPHAMSTEAVKVKFKGKEHWVGVDQPLKIFDSQQVYILSYGRKRINVGFPIQLKKFSIVNYPGTMQAKSYESVVEVEGKEELISMNEPIKKKGFTFYQSSFQRDPATGQPTHSVLSVNKDPGRFLKYLGSLLICLGTLLLFYFRKRGHKWRFLK